MMFRACLIAMVLSGSALAQPPAPATPAPGQPAPPRFRPPRPVTRAELGLAYLDLDAAMEQFHPDAQSVRTVNKEFDALTMLFFAGNFSGATGRVHELTRGIRGEAGADYHQRLARSLKVTVEPPVVVPGPDTKVSIRATSMYRVEPPPGVRTAVSVSLLARDGAVAATHAFTIESPDAVDVTADGVVLPPGLQTGRYEVRIKAGDGAPMLAGWWTVTRAPLSARKAAVLATLDQAMQAHPGSKLQIGICRARAGLLTDRPTSASSAEFLLDLDLHASEVEREASQLLEGRSAYPNGPGAWWMGVPIDQTVFVPAEVYAPSRPERAGQPRPLVVALHGAGGDEMMFFAGYGQGRIKALADEHDFVVVAPRTEILMGNPANFDRLVEAVAALYPIDASRIYVIGHSMGAGGAAGLAMARADRIAAVSCIAGGPMFPARAPCAPLFLFEAELDGLMSPDRFEKSAESARKAGAPVQFELVRDWGHTLVVGHILPRAVEAMLKVDRPPPSRLVPGQWGK